MDISKINWESYSENSVADVSMDQIEAIEKILGVRLPYDYLLIAKLHNGERPIPGDIDIGKRSTIVTYLLTLEAEVSNSSDSLLSSYQNNDDRDDKIVPFAIAGGASRFCFDYRENNSIPTIVFDNSDIEYSDPRSIVKVCNTFTEFLEKLYLDEE